MIAKYQGAQEAWNGLLPLDFNIFMNKLLVAGIRVDRERSEHRSNAAQFLAKEKINIAPMVIHRLPWQETSEAYPYASQQT